MRTEDDLQKRVRAFLDHHLPAGAIWTAIDKGVVYSGDQMQRIRTAARMKARGVKNGTEDVQVIYGQRIRAVELKTGTKQSEAQEIRQGGLIANGHAYAVCRSVMDVHDFLLRDGMPIEPAARIAAMRYDAMGAPAVKGKRASTPRAEKPKQRALAKVAAMRARTMF
ncbi:MAG TPA: hypothetical protein VN702_17450 [Acetobacteraceae bacterium]|nr:hypothetical protein [Acetobacteraceae bacterium]